MKHTKEKGAFLENDYSRKKNASISKISLRWVSESGASDDGALRSEVICLRKSTTLGESTLV